MWLTLFPAWEPYSKTLLSKMCSPSSSLSGSSAWGNWSCRKPSQFAERCSAEGWRAQVFCNQNNTESCDISGPSYAWCLTFMPGMSSGPTVQPVGQDPLEQLPCPKEPYRTTLSSGRGRKEPMLPQSLFCVWAPWRDNFNPGNGAREKDLNLFSPDCSSI